MKLLMSILLLSVMAPSAFAHPHKTSDAQAPNAQAPNAQPLNPLCEVEVPDNTTDDELRSLLAKGYSPIETSYMQKQGTQTPLKFDDFAIVNPDGSNAISAADAPNVYQFFYDSSSFNNEDNEALERPEKSIRTRGETLLQVFEGDYTRLPLKSCQELVKQLSADPNCAIEVDNEWASEGTLMDALLDAGYSPIAHEEIKSRSLSTPSLKLEIQTTDNSLSAKIRAQNGTIISISEDQTIGTSISSDVSREQKIFEFVWLGTDLYKTIQQLGTCSEVLAKMPK